MGRRHAYKCVICGQVVSNMVNHIVAAHNDVVMSNTTVDAAQILGVSDTTIRCAKKIIAPKPSKICPRCKREYNSKAKHMVEYHLLALVCARNVGLENGDIAQMLFNGVFRANDVSLVFQWLKNDDQVEIDDEDMPKMGIPICSDGNGGIRVMQRGEIGVGVIFADEGVSW